MPVIWKADRALVAEPFATDVDRLLAADPGCWYVTAGARDVATESAGYAAFLADPAHAPRYTDPLHSAHCCTPARAVDVTLVKDAHDDWAYDDPDWRRLVAKVQAHPRLHSLDAIGDTDHIEQVGWHQFATFLPVMV